jgi:hypothetical protein
MLPLRRGSSETRTVRTQTVIMAFGFFDTNYKPDARSFNVQAADLDSILKHGVSISGEWFYSGERLPGGKRRGELPDSIKDREALPLFPEVELVIEVTDGAPSQFDNKTHYHQTAAWRARDGIRRQGIKLVTMHGKSVCDGASNSPKLALAEAGAEGKLVAPGARAAALYLVQHKPTPSKAKIDGGGYWAADAILYGYYDTSLFTASAVPDALPFTGSSKVHMSVGMCDDKDKAERDGPLTWRNVVCPCAPCCRLDFPRCQMTGEFGSVKQSNVKRASATGLPSQSASLEDFSKEIKANMVVAFRVADDEATIEGAVWLALMDGAVETLAKDERHAGQLFEKGWTVARGHWFSLTRADPTKRIYRALEEETLFNVQAMMRLTNVRFQQGIPRHTRGTGADWYKNNEFTLSDDAYQILLNSL